MERNYIFESMDSALPALCSELTDHGALVPSRLGDDTKELRHVGVTLTRPLDREVLAGHRNASIVAQIAETMWVLRGRSDITWLGQYLPRAHEFSDDGTTWRGAYGPRLRRYGMAETDQLQHVVDLLRADPNTRRAVLSIYDPNIDVHPGKDIPCNDFMSFSLRDGRLDAHVFIRSNDLVWGWSGINAFEWSVVLEVIAWFVGAEPGSLHFSITSLHAYDRHFKRLEKIASAPRVTGGWEQGRRFNPHGMRFQQLRELDLILDWWFDIEDRARTGNDVHDVIAQFEEQADPLLGGFLRVIASHWLDDNTYMTPLLGTRLAEAYSRELWRTQERKTETRVTQQGEHVPNDFDRFVAELHAEKHAAYGDSWRKRGELFSILPNVARKVDRLASGKDTTDETQADTAIDLLVYLIKYRIWLAQNVSGVTYPSALTQPLIEIDYTNEVELVALMLKSLPTGALLLNETHTIQQIEREFNALLEAAERKDINRYRVVDLLLGKANLLARSRAV